MNLTTDRTQGVSIVRVNETRLMYPLLGEFANTITSLIGALQDFPRFQLLTGGGPNYSTTTIVYYLYTVAFEYSEMGYASAIAWFIGVIIMLVILINFLLSKRWVHYN